MKSLKSKIDPTGRQETEVEHPALNGIAWRHLNRPKVLEHNPDALGPGRRLMIRCPYCGAKNKDDFEYCVRCSEPLEFAHDFQPSPLRFLVPLLVVVLAGAAIFVIWQRMSPRPAPATTREAAGGSAAVTSVAPPEGRPFDAGLAKLSTREGLQAFRNGDYAAAVDHLGRFVDEAPDNPFGHMYLGLAYHNLGDPEAATEAMQAAFELVPGSSSFQRYLVAMLRGSGQDAQAEQVLQQYLELNPTDQTARVELARTMRAEGKTEEAILGMQEVLAQSPENLSARLELGESLKTAGRVEEAAVAFRNAAETNPESAVAHHALGVTELAAGNFSKSLEPLQEAVRLDEENGGFRLALAQAYENLDKISESLSEYEAFVRLSPNDPLAPKIEKLLTRAKSALAERQAQKKSGGSS